MDYFAALAEDRNPGTEQLQQFVLAVKDFMGAVIDLSILDPDDEATEAPYLFRLFQEDTQIVFKEHLPKHFQDVYEAIPNAEESYLIAHGLIGYPQHFKFKVLDGVEKARKFFKNVWAWIREMFGIIDVILDSLLNVIAAVCKLPVGGAIKEVKETIKITLAKLRQRAQRT